MDEKIFLDMNLTIDGMGIVFYSDGAVKNISEGEDFFSREYEDEEKVAEHIKKGDIVGFCTGSGGNCILKFINGYPSSKIDEEYPISIRLGILIEGGRLFVKDIFSLMDWTKDCPENQQLKINDGVYYITLKLEKYMDF